MHLIDPRKVFLTGVSYETASTQLRGNSLPVQLIQQFAFPSLQLTFMSLEIYLKCLQLILIGRMKTGHDLHKLFRILPNYDKKILERDWIKIINSPPYKNLRAEFANNMPVTLYDTLRHANFMHMHSRYPWEANGNRNVFIAQEIPRLFYEHIVYHRPEWRLPIVDGH